jgi:hypothetical protein
MTIATQADIDAFRSIADDIQRGNVQDRKRLVLFEELGWVTTMPGTGKTERWILTAAGLHVHAYGKVRPEG